MLASAIASPLRRISSRALPRLKRQGGGVLVMAALWIGVAMSCLMVLDIANLFWQQRELQKIADLSALAGADRPLMQACSANAGASALINAQSNGLKNEDNFLPAYGVWIPNPSQKLEEFFTRNYDAEADLNACQITVQRTVPYFFMVSASGNKSRELSAQATALNNSKPLAMIAVRSTLASLEEGVLNALLKSLLGSSVNLKAIGWGGLANVNVNLLKFLGPLAEVNLDAGGYDSLLQTKVSVASIIQAMINAVEPGKAATVGVGILNNMLGIGLDKVFIQLGDILKIDNSLPGSALDVGLNALELIQGSLQVATQKNAVALDLKLLGLADVKVKIVEPAQLSIIGDPSDDRVIIESRTAQIRLLVMLESKLIAALTKLVNTVLAIVNLIIAPITALLGQGVPDLDILPSDPFVLNVLVDVGRGYARVDAAQCSAGQKSIDITAKKAVVDVYLGELVGATKTEKENNAFGPGIPLVNPIPLLDMGVLPCGIELKSCPRKPFYFGGLGLGAHIRVLEVEAQKTFVGDQVNSFGELPAGAERIYSDMQMPNLQSLSGLIKGLSPLKKIAATSDKPSILGLVADIVEGVTEKILPAILSLLDPLATVLEALLNALGVSVNKVEVAPYLRCGGGATLVY